MRTRRTRRELRAVGVERDRSSYGVVLLLIVITFAFMSAAPTSNWARIVSLVLQAITLLSALIQSHVSRGLIRATLVLTVAAVAAATALLFVGTEGSEFDTRSTGVALLITAGLIAIAPAAIVKGVLDSLRANRRVTTQAVLGAVCVYLLFGIFFASLYNAAGSLDGGDFFTSGDGTVQDYVYFSYVTLTTLGYGDFAPAQSVGRTFAILEALLGQLYLVTIIALLVGNVGAQARRGARSADEDAGHTR